MSVQKNQEIQNLSAEQKLFQQIYNKKFFNPSSTLLTQRRRIIANQLKPASSSNLDNEKPNNNLNYTKKSKSTGSLLPQLKQIEIIAKSQKQPLKKVMSSSLSKLDVYLANKNIKRQQQYNLVFLTQTTSILSDKIMQQKFNHFISLSQQDKPKNLRALLNLAGGQQLSQQARKKKISSQKQELQGIVRQMIQQHHNIAQQQKNQSQKDKNSEQLSQNESIKIPNRSKQKDIAWVLKQCKRYDKKFRVKRNKQSKLKKQKSKIKKKQK